jgi:hypothetical protein
MALSAKNHSRTSAALAGHDVLSGAYSTAAASTLDFGSQDFLMEEVLLPPWGGVSFSFGGLYFGPDQHTPGFTVQGNVLSVSANVDLGTTAHVLGVWRHGTTIELRIDGVSTAATLSSAVTFSGGVLLGDADGSFNFQFLGSYGEVVLATAPLQASTVAGVELYLRTRYGL